MLMTDARVLLTILYSIALIISLSRCSPNVSSIDRAVLRGLQQQSGSASSSSNGGGINVDASFTFKQPPLKLHFVRDKEARRLRDESESKEETRIRLASNENGAGNLIGFKENGKVEFALEHSAHLYPAEAWVVLDSKALVDQARAENCRFDVQPAHEGTWLLSLRETEECKSRQELLARTEEIFISFRVKDSRHLIDPVMTPDAP